MRIVGEGQTRRQAGFSSMGTKETYPRILAGDNVMGC